MPAQPSVLVLASAPPGAARVEDVVGRLRAAGARVLLAAPRVPSEIAALVDASRELGPAAGVHGPAFRRAVRGVDRATRLRLLAESDAWVQAQAAAVDLVTALEEEARPAARALADAFPGLVMRPRPKGVLELLAQGVTARGDAPVSVPPVPPVDEAAVLAQAEGLDDRARADLLGEVVSAALGSGEPTGLAQSAYAAELAVADRHFAAGETSEAAWAFGEALRTAFHPALHFDALTSPLAEDAAGFTAPLWGSAVARAVRGPERTGGGGSGGSGFEAPASGWARRPPITSTTGEARPVRLLIAVRGTEMFAQLIRRHFEEHPGYETRYVAFPELPGLMRYVDHPAAWAEQVLTGAGELRGRAEELLRPHLEWADVLFVDWCSQLAGLVTRVDPGDTRVVVRLHSYEPFTRWPQLVDFGRVDDIVFVSEHLRRLSAASIPGLREAGTRQHVVPNAVDLRPFARPKLAEARFTLALVGASKIVKDPRWTIEVLRELRRHDERYRLLLIGGRFQDSSPAVHGYAEALAADLAELGPAVERIRFTDDVPAALQQVGVVVSSSVRESFHLGLVEGAASGAVPVVRAWPFFPGAPAELFPADWVVQTPAQAAERILALTADEATWRAAGEAAAEEVLGRWDWSVVAGGYERLFAGEE